MRRTFTFKVDPAAPQHLSDQLAERIRSAISEHKLRPGDRLPSFRQLARLATAPIISAS